MLLLTLLVFCVRSHVHCEVTTLRTDAGLFEIVQQLVLGQQSMLERVVMLQNEMEQQIGDLKSSVDDLKNSSTHIGEQMDGLVTTVKEMEQSIQRCNEVWKTNSQSQYHLFEILSMK